ncbi:N-6 DNA methylase [Escherichia coli]|nr:N-6 DNA methylase [Escherichia coli]
MEKQFKKTLASIQTRSNRSSSDTVREFFNCVSYTMIMNSLFQLERRELFYSGSNIYGFNQLAIQAGFIEKSIMLTDRHKFSIEEKFYNQFDTEIIDTANLISLEIQKQPLTDVFNRIFEDCYLTGKKSEWLGQFLTPNRLAEAISRFVGWEKDIKYNIGDCCAGTGSLLFPLLREIHSKEGYEGVQKIELLYNEIDPLMAQLFMAQILTNMTYHNLDFKSLHVYIGNAITEYDTVSTLFLRFKQNKLVAQRVLEIDKEKKAA